MKCDTAGWGPDGYDTYGNSAYGGDMYGGGYDGGFRQLMTGISGDGTDDAATGNDRKLWEGMYGYGTGSTGGGGCPQGSIDMGDFCFHENAGWCESDLDMMIFDGEYYQWYYYIGAYYCWNMCNEYTENPSHEFGNEFLGTNPAGTNLRAWCFCQDSCPCMTKPRNPRHFDGVGGGRKRVCVCFFRRFLFLTKKCFMHLEERNHCFMQFLASKNCLGHFFGHRL